MIVRLVYFSGTGCTRYVAEAFEKELLANNIVVDVQDLRVRAPELSNRYDMLIICYVVHASNPPRPIIDWVEMQKDIGKIPTIVISVSGGGQITPNKGAHVAIKRVLKRKKFNVFYEKMIVMPSNWTIPTKPEIGQALIDVLPLKVAYIVHDILDRKNVFIKPGVGNRIISFLCRLEWKGSKYFGKDIKVNDNCIGCSICEKNCPVGNIENSKVKPQFLDKCVLCLNCIYSCPQKALSAGILKFMVIKQGFDFKKYLIEPIDIRNLDIKAETKGYLWLGVRNYLLNKEDILQPKYKS